MALQRVTQDQKMGRNQKHRILVAGLWLMTTIWPLLIVPVHFRITEHEKLHAHAGDYDHHTTDFHSECSVCDFFFYRSLPVDFFRYTAYADLVRPVFDHPDIALCDQKLFLLSYLRAPPVSSSRIYI